jgi:flagellar basal body rod protein FlgG
MIPGIQSSLAALFTFGKKISSNSQNVANSNTDGYKKRVTRVSEGRRGLPEAQTTISDTPGLIIQEEDKTRETSNVDLTEEMPQMMIATRAYEANLKSIKTQDEVLKSTLDMLV